MGGVSWRENKNKNKGGKLIFINYIYKKILINYNTFNLYGYSFSLLVILLFLIYLFFASILSFILLPKGGSR